jgi:hypothetical protein
MRQDVIKLLLVLGVLAELPKETYYIRHVCLPVCLFVRMQKPSTHRDIS